MSQDSNDPKSTPEPKVPEGPPFGTSLVRRFTRLKFKERVIFGFLALCASLSIVTTIGIIYVLVSQAIVSPNEETAFFQDERVTVTKFLTDTEWNIPREEDMEAGREAQIGIFALLTSTLWIALIAAVVGLPIGLGAAIYLSEYASPRLRKFAKPTLEVLAGIPTVVFGFFALRFITPAFDSVLGFFGAGHLISTFNLLSAGVVVGIMVIPMVCSLSEDALRSVPRSLREAGYALGATKFDVSTKVVLPAALSGIVAAFILALSRAIGETMAVAIAAGTQPNLTFNPLNAAETMTGYMVHTAGGDVGAAGSLRFKSLYAVGLTLFFMTLTLNLISQAVMRRFREAYE